MARLNIFFLNSIDKSIWGGLENWMEMCGLGLAQKGHQVYFAGRAKSKFLKRISSHDKLSIFPMKIGGDFNPFVIKKISQISKSYSIDVVVCNLVKDARMAGLARKFGGKYKIVWSPGVNLAKKTWSHRNMFLKYIDSVIVPSAYLRDEITESGFIEKNKFDVLPIGIDRELWKSNRNEGRKFLHSKYRIPDDAFVCLTSGRFVEQKGHKYLLDAAEQLLRRCGNIYFLWLGDGPLENEHRKRIEAIGFGERFIFAGLLEKHQRAVFGSDLYVHPAIAEPFGIVLVEAMAAGLPIVATRVGGIPEVVSENENAILVNPADATDLTAAIELFYNDKTLREKYGRFGYERFTEKFNLEIMVDKVEAHLLKPVQ
ncbi:MAG: glycosyltransferase family 4 protein [Candidatus Zixiibacteriota bacterium]